MTADPEGGSGPMAMQAPSDERSSFSLSYLAQRNIVAAELEVCEARLADLTAERDRMRPVVEAAEAWRAGHWIGYPHPLAAAFFTAVDAYRSTLGQDGAVRPPQAAADATDGPDAGNEPHGCPQTVWDGPYSYRCSLGGTGWICAKHGQFGPSERPILALADEDGDHDDAR